MAGGIILLVVGLIVTAIGAYFYTIQQQNIEACSTFTGGLGQFFDSENRAICERAPSIAFTSLMVLIVGIIMIIIGGILAGIGFTRKSVQTMAGSVTGGEKKGRITQIEPVNLNMSQQLNTTDKIYCRYCGKLRPATGNYCPLCGRSTSTYVNRGKGMKQCIKCSSLSSDDSLFCSNCGRRFSQESSFTSDRISKAPVSPYSYHKTEVSKDYENLDHAFRIKYPSNWEYENMKI